MKVWVMTLIVGVIIAAAVITFCVLGFTDVINPKLSLVLITTWFIGAIFEEVFIAILCRDD